MLPSETVNFSLRGLEAQAKPHNTQVQSIYEFNEAFHTGLRSHRSQRCGVKLIDTHCKTVAVMVSYDLILYVCELCGHEVCREFLVNTMVVHMK